MRRNGSLSGLMLTALAGGFAAGLIASPAASAAVLASQSFEDYQGAGLAPDGGGGRLDSTQWAVQGFSDGDSAFGDTRSSGDLARGQASQPVRSGGLFAFSLPSDQVGLGVQATSSDFSPGALLWRLANQGTLAWESLTLSFDLWARNDGQRATGLAVELAMANSPSDWIPLPEASHRTLAEADSLGWVVQSLTAALPAPLPPGQEMTLRFTLADAAGTGVRDEIAFSDFLLSGDTAGGASVPLPLPGALMLAACGLPWVSVTARRARKRHGRWQPAPVNEA